MTQPSESTTRTIVLSADHFFPCPVVFEVRGLMHEIPPGGEMRFVVSGPPNAKFEIGYGSNGVSVYRDLDLEVEVYDHNGQLLEIEGFG